MRSLCSMQRQISPAKRRTPVNLYVAWLFDTRDCNAAIQRLESERTTHLAARYCRRDSHFLENSFPFTVKRKITPARRFFCNFSIKFILRQWHFWVALSLSLLFPFVGRFLVTGGECEMERHSNKKIKYFLKETKTSNNISLLHSFIAWWTFSF